MERFITIKNLKKLNYDFKTLSDTEVILAMYEKFGLESFKLLEGMFSFNLGYKKKN